MTQRIQSLEFSTSITGNRHIQTLLAMLKTVSKENIRSSHHLVPLPDGGALSCELSTPPGWHTQLPTVYLLHGLGGSSLSSYMMRMTLKLQGTLNARIIRINLRGCGSGAPFAKRPYHAGLSRDLHAVVRHFHQGSPSCLVSYSLGGNLALKMAGEEGDGLNMLLKGMVAVCPPFHLERSLERVTKAPFIYERYMAIQVRKQYDYWISHHPEIPKARFPALMSLLAFDQIHTAPFWGFKDAYDYYTNSSCAPWIPQIQLPCHIFCSADDPVADTDSAHELQIPENVTIWLSLKGGHMGFVDPLHKNVHWLDSKIIGTLESFLKS